MQKKLTNIKFLILIEVIYKKTWGTIRETISNDKIS